jgi:hypothetical protein
MSENTSTTSTTDGAASQQDAQAPAQQANSAGQAPVPTPGEIAAQRAAQQSAATTTDWDGKVESLPADVQKLIAGLRKEAGDARVNAKTAAAEQAKSELAQTIGKALGIVKDGDAAPDPEQLAKTAADSAASERQARVELAVFRAASAAKADPTALLDSRAFLAKVADLDPTDTGFADAVKTAITEAVKDNPKLAATQAVAGASSVDHAGGTGEGAVTAEQFAAMKPAEKNALFLANPTLYRQLTGR